MNPPDVTKILQQTKDESLDEKKWDEEFSTRWTHKMLTKILQRKMKKDELPDVT